MSDEDREVLMLFVATAVVLYVVYRIALGAAMSVWAIVGLVEPGDVMVPYLCDPTTLYRILVPLDPLDDAWDTPHVPHSIHALPLGACTRKGVLVARIAWLPDVQPGAVRDRPCSRLWEATT